MFVHIAPVTLPSDLKNQNNGKLQSCSLSPVYFHGVGHASLHTLAARAWNAMTVVAFAETKAHMTVTSTADAYRSYDQQQTVFLQRYRSVYNPLTCTLDSSRVWQGKKWYKLKKVAPVATPGTSNHGWGLAVDCAALNIATMKPVGITTNNTLWLWLLTNARTFGFSWEGVSDSTALGFEPWHIRYFMGDALPKRVIDVEQFLANASKPKA